MASTPSRKWKLVDWRDVVSGAIGAVLAAAILWIAGYLGTRLGQFPVPRGAVVAFESEKCPEGWDRELIARGRYIVGLNDDGHLGATKGEPLVDQEDRPTGQHTHLYNYMSVGGSGGDIAWGGDAKRSQIQVETGVSKGTPGTDAGKPGTNAPYVQLLYCRKQ